ncbi:NUC173 domain protein [Dictyocaulus viviparus]|uniref:NUC173 domain protein n=1 Tax=Dictyocaulus viviparus TaxID=29172 RepID=A0A0D8XZ79_DICVI|nr:NUC173 domain protein [Dictyocaulus viviparus]
MVVKHRYRIYRKTKIRVKKGMSSESNPTKRRHREAANASRISALPIEMLKAVDERSESASNLLDELNEMRIGHEQDLSNKSIVSDGAVSRISQFTACTNRSFDVVHRYWRSGSTMQKDVVAVLAAVTEVIKDYKGSETDVEYFSALLTALEGSSSFEPSKIAAVAFLLHLVVKKLPKEILQTRFTIVVQILYAKILESTENGEGSALKYLLCVLGVVLRAQPAHIWNVAKNKELMVSITALCTHGKPWVRTMARRVVRSVLNDPVRAMDNGIHAASTIVGMYIEQQLYSTPDSSNGSVTVVRYLSLLEGILHKMPSIIFKQLAEILLRLLTLTDRKIKCNVLQCLYRCFLHQPCDAALSADTNASLIEALKQLFLPSDDIVCSYWMQALGEAHVCLATKDPYRCYSILPLYFEMILGSLNDGNEQLAHVVISRIIDRSIKNHETCAKGLLLSLDRALNARSYNVWKHVLRFGEKYLKNTFILAANFFYRLEMRLFEVSGAVVIGEEFNKAMKTLSLLRENNKCFCIQEIDLTIGYAVRHVGACAVLSAIPLGIDADAAVLNTEFNRSWMIPVLRNNLHNASLEFFLSEIFPLAMKIFRYFIIFVIHFSHYFKRSKSLDPVAQRLYMTLQAQLWELLPKICESPSDIEKSFPQLAPILGAALNERIDLRPSILSAIRCVLRFSLPISAFPERCAVVGAYAKNFMPLLFNLYAANSDSNVGFGVQTAILETIRLYAEITPSELLKQFINAAITKAADAFNDATKQARILDILCAIVRCADCSTFRKVLDTIEPWFTMDKMQKKAFRILEELLFKRFSPEMKSFFSEKSFSIINTLLLPITIITPPARAAFCACIKAALDFMDDLPELTDFCLKSLDSVVLALDKSNNTHARSNASKCLQYMLIKLIEIGGKNEQHPSSIVNDLLTRIYELSKPLADSGDGAIELSAARSTLILNGGHLARLIAHGCALIGDGRPPVRILVIRLLRILVQKLPEFALQEYRHAILSSVFDGQLTCDVTSKVRKANRILLEVLVTKFGVDLLLKYTSKPEWVKQIRNIEKLNRRKARKIDTVEDSSDGMNSSVFFGKCYHLDKFGFAESKSAVTSIVTSKTADADTILELLDDSSGSDVDCREEQVEVQNLSGSVWMKEDADMCDSTDLLDRKDMLLKVTTCNPVMLVRHRRKIVGSKEKTFKMSKDGKLLISDDCDNSVEKSRKRKKEFDKFHGGLIQEDKKRKEMSDYSGDSEDSNIKFANSIQCATSRHVGSETKRRSKDGSSRKKKQKLQPYVYVPLRRKGVKQRCRSHNVGLVDSKAGK